MNRPKRMLLENIAWARETAHADTQFFPRLAQGQSPKVLWIGCSDSRVPAETVTHANPGDLFVHRNIANLFHPSDDNTLSVLEYAVRVLKVDHVIVCGHYGCGGVRASLLPLSNELPHVNRRIAPLCALGERHRAELDTFGELDARTNRLAELNVLEQVRLLRQTPIVRDRDAPPLVHGWIFGLHDGLLKVLASGYDDEAHAIAEPTQAATRQTADTTGR
jgi:carbonic anhydrase